MIDGVNQELLANYEDLANRESLRLLRGIALEGRRASDELKLLLDSQDKGPADFQAFALTVVGQSLGPEQACRVLRALKTHVADLAGRLGRAVGLRTAALDLAEGLESAFEVQGEEAALGYGELSNMAFNDPLTGLNNYRYFSMRFKEEIQRAERYRHPVSLIMFDIDHFKAFNDTHGHPAGNQALIQVGQALLEESRDTDLVARYGGEEFAFILPETTKRMAHKLAERIRRRIENTPIRLVSGERHRVTASLGAATFPRDSCSGEGLLDGADKALYEAKRAGRNRVQIYQPGTWANFHYKPKGGQVHSVSMVANFNGWDERADPMSPAADGGWQIRVAVVPGTYEYKFVINGEHWIKDPSQTESVEDGYWGENSIARVTKTQAGEKNGCRSPTMKPNGLYAIG